MSEHFLKERISEAYSSLSDRERCVFDHYFGSKFENYTYSDIAKICWPDRENPVTDPMVSAVVREIRKKFEMAIFEIDIEM